MNDNERISVPDEKPGNPNLDRERLWASVGHDLRMPLQAIMVCASRLSVGTTDAQTEIIAKRITAASHRMARLITDAIDISKLQSGLGLRMNRQSLDCNDLIKEIMAETLLVFPQAMMTFDNDGDGIVMADADRISQVLSNLLGNAIHHGLPGTPITIVSCKVDDAFKIVVSNFSPVLEDQLLFDMFSPFKSGVAAGNANRHSLGLGLYIVRKIVEEHAGSISVQQESGIMSFMVTLPIR